MMTRSSRCSTGRTAARSGPPRCTYAESRGGIRSGSFESVCSIVGSPRGVRGIPAASVSIRPSALLRPPLEVHRADAHLVPAGVYDLDRQGVDRDQVVRPDPETRPTIK